MRVHENVTKQLRRDEYEAAKAAFHLANGAIYAVLSAGLTPTVAQRAEAASARDDLVGSYERLRRTLAT